MGPASQIYSNTVRVSCKLINPLLIPKGSLENYQLWSSISFIEISPKDIPIIELYNKLVPISTHLGHGENWVDL